MATDARTTGEAAAPPSTTPEEAGDLALEQLAPADSAHKAEIDSDVDSLLDEINTHLREVISGHAS